MVSIFDVRVCFAMVVVTVMAVFTGLSGSSVAQGANFQFAKVADSSSGIGTVSDQAPQINDVGSVMFETTTNSGAIYLARGGSLTNVYSTLPFTGDSIDLGGMRQLNNNDQIVFDGRKDSALQILYWSGGVLSSLYDSRGPGNGSLDSVTGAPTINNHGIVAFAGDGYRQNGIFVGNATPPTLAVSGAPFNQVGPPLMNDNGTIAYYANVNNVSQAIYLNTGGVTQVVASASPTGSIPGLRATALNSHGTVAYLQTISTMQSLYVGDGVQSTKIVDGTGPFAGEFSPVALNDAGEVAFGINLTVVGGALYNGPDPIANRVIGVGDILFGGRIEAISFKSAGLNNHGDLAFAATLVNPVTGQFMTEGIYVAHVVPEPATMLLAATGIFCTVFFGRKRGGLARCRPAV